MNKEKLEKLNEKLILWIIALIIISLCLFLVVILQNFERDELKKELKDKCPIECITLLDGEKNIIATTCEEN